ncbi:hypothetical protein [Sphingomonas sp.]|uniref:hypothetical protein n=1 Tax=Sphingomonas sp. TaxID=28214 RepID=UPI0025F58816|nr:hypothetical protein [Sphingomonas sp.]
MDFSAKQIAGAVAAALAILALAAGIIDWRHRKRSDLDRVSLIDWRNVQVFALIATIIAAAVAFQL